MPSSTDLNLAVVGGGLSGLCAAQRLRELAPGATVRLFEAGTRLGGSLYTTSHDSFVVEHGADMLSTREPWAIDLCRKLSVELINTNAEHRRAMVVHQGKPVPIPSGFALTSPGRYWPILTTRILSPSGKLRLARERFVPPGTGDDESLSSFGRRRFGDEVFDRLIQPLVGGIYAANPDKLSMAAALPQVFEMERKYGSLIRGTRSETKRPVATGANYGAFVAPRGGMSALVQAIVMTLMPGTIRFNSSVAAASPADDGRWALDIARSARRHFDGVILALPSQPAARVLAERFPEVAGVLREIRYASAAVLAFGFRREDIRHPLDAFGFVVPHIEKRQILAASFSSVKFNGRAGDDQVLIRVFIGGAMQSELLALEDDQLIDIATSELKQLIDTQRAPLFTFVERWGDSMPQYHVGHLKRVERIEAWAQSMPGIELAGNAYRGVGIPFCVRSGHQAAERLVDQLVN